MSSLLLGWGLVLATHQWCILDPSVSSLGSTGAQQRGCGAERSKLEGGWKGGILVSKVDHCLWLRCGRLPQPHQAGLAKSHSPLSPTPSLSFSGLSIICPIHHPPGCSQASLPSAPCLSTSSTIASPAPPRTHPSPESDSHKNYLLSMQTCCPLGSSSDPWVL